jgi:hypothetical protein
MKRFLLAAVLLCSVAALAQSVGEPTEMEVGPLHFRYHGRFFTLTPEADSTLCYEQEDPSIVECDPVPFRVTIINEGDAPEKSPDQVQAALRTGASPTINSTDRR